MKFLKFFKKLNKKRLPTPVTSQNTAQAQAQAQAFTSFFRAERATIDHRRTMSAPSDLGKMPELQEPPHSTETAPEQPAGSSTSSLSFLGGMPETQLEQYTWWSSPSYSSILGDGLTVRLRRTVSAPSLHRAAERTVYLRCVRSETVFGVAILPRSTPLSWATSQESTRSDVTVVKQVILESRFSPPSEEPYLSQLHNEKWRYDLATESSSANAAQLQDSSQPQEYVSQVPVHVSMLTPPSAPSEPIPESNTMFSPHELPWWFDYLAESSSAQQEQFQSTENTVEIPIPAPTSPQIPPITDTHNTILEVQNTNINSPVSQVEPWRLVSAAEPSSADTRQQGPYQAEDDVQVSIRMPDGERLIGRFSRDSDLQHIFQLVDAAGTVNPSSRLVMVHPTQVFTREDTGLVIRELGFRNMEEFFINNR